MKKLSKKVNHAILNLAYELEKVLEAAPSEIPDVDTLLKEIAARFERVRFAHRRSIPTSMVREASELALFVALYVHKVKHGN